MNVSTVLRMIPVLGAMVLLPWGCNISDDERCLDGYYFDDMTNNCLPLPDDGGGDQGDSTADVAKEDADPGADGGGQNTDAEAGAGFGESCVEQSDCVTDADFCTYNDFVGTGICTYTDCTADSCPAGYICCDCTQSPVPFPVMCGPEDDAQLKTFCDCMARP